MNTNTNYEVQEHDIEDIKARVRELLLDDPATRNAPGAFGYSLAAFALLGFCWAVVGAAVALIWGTH